MDITELEEKLYCLNFEHQSLRDWVINKKAERWVRGNIDPITENHHLERYNYACQFTNNKNVLDIAGGAGYGTYLIGTIGKAKHVTAVDIDNSAIKYGDLKYPAENISRVYSDGTQFTTTKKFDLIVSFETIEHIENFEKFIDNLHDLLKDDGELIISTPINKVTTKDLINPYHFIEWSFYDFHKLFTGKFDIQEIHVQSLMIENLIYKLIPSIIRKPINLIGRLFFNKILIDKSYNTNSFEKYTSQYEMKNCINGYQVLKLKKAMQ